MRWPILTALGLILSFSSVAVAQEKPLAPATLERAAKYIASGKVERVYTTEKVPEKGDAVAPFALEVIIGKIKKGEGMGSEGITPGETVFVKGWQQTETPKRGDIVDLYFNGKNRSFVAITRSG